MSKCDQVRCIIEEYSTNIVDGCGDVGDFFLVTHKKMYLNEICRRIKPLGYMLSDSNFDKSGEYCTSRFQPHDEWFEHPYFFKY
jgi:hypothetical protein